MNFGMFTDFHVRKGMSQPEAFDESFAQVIEAEKMGLDSVWLAEHHFSPVRSVLASPMVLCSAIAARTSKIRIGMAVQVLPLTNLASPSTMPPWASATCLTSASPNPAPRCRRTRSSFAL